MYSPKHLLPADRAPGSPRSHESTIVKHQSLNHLGEIEWSF